MPVIMSSSHTEKCGLRCGGRGLSVVLAHGSLGACRAGAHPWRHLQRRRATRAPALYVTARVHRQCLLMIFLRSDIRRVARIVAVGKDTLGGSETLRCRVQQALFSIAATCLVFNVLARGKFRFMRRNWEFITSLTIILIVALFMVRLEGGTRERRAEV